MYDSLNGFLIDNKEILNYDLCHEAALDCYLLGLTDGENKYQPKRVVINGIKFNVDSLDFQQFVSKIVELPAEFNYALYHLAKFKIDYQIEAGEFLNIRIDLCQYIINILDFGTPEEINLIINALVKWRDLINFYYHDHKFGKTNDKFVPKHSMDNNLTTKALMADQNSTHPIPVGSKIDRDIADESEDTKLSTILKSIDNDADDMDNTDDDSIWDDDLLDDEDDDLPKPSQEVTNNVNDILKAAQDNLISEQKQRQKEKQEKEQAIDSEIVPIDSKIVPADSDIVPVDSKIISNGNEIVPNGKVAPTSAKERAEYAARHAEALRKKILDKRAEMFAKDVNNKVIISNKTSQNKSAKK